MDEILDIKPERIENDFKILEGFLVNKILSLTKRSFL